MTVSRRGRLGLAISMGLACLLAVFGGAVRVVTERVLLAALDRSLRAEALAMFDLHGASAVPSTRYGVVALGGGALPAQMRALAPSLRQGESVCRDEWIGGRLVRVCYLPVRTPRGVLQKVAVASGPRAPVETALGGLDQTALLLSPVVLIVSALGGALASRGILAPIREVSEAEVARLTGQVNDMRDQLNLAVVRQRQFLADASHELRTPLSAAKATADWLREEMALTELQREAVDEMNGALNRSNRLVADLLLLARLEAGAYPVRRQAVAVAAVLERAVSEAVADRGAPHAPIVADIDPTLAVVADPDLLARAIANLVRNAVAYTPPSGRIDISAGYEERVFALRIGDTGRGIPAAALERLGDPFYRPDPARDRASGGVGLGLAICHAIAHALSGRLILTSALDHGTTAVLRLGDPEAATPETARRSH